MFWKNALRTHTTSAMLLASLALFSTRAAETPMIPTKTEQSQPRTTPSTVTESRFSREQWNLTETEWERYSTLMQGVRGSISPANLSPIEVLGVHARTEDERMKYARLWAKMRKADIEHILAFQRAYDVAWQELNPSGIIIDYDKLPHSPIIENTIRSGDRVLLFMRLKNCPECQALYTRVRRAAFEANTQFDIYFSDTKPGEDDQAIVDWIARNHFDDELVKQKKITFNHDPNNSALKRAGGDKATAPAAYRIRNELIDPIQIGMPGL